MTNELQAQIAQLEGQIQTALDEWSMARDGANAAEREVQEMMLAARALRERRAAAATRANAAEQDAAQRWREFRQIEAQLKAAQRRAGLPVTGASDTVLHAHGIASQEAVGAL